MTMPVPASYNDIKEGVDFRDHYGWVFYQRHIAMPPFAKGQRILLRCAAVSHHAKIYLNGEMICEHRGGFLPFEVDISDKLTDGDNLLTIAVDNVIDYSTLPVGGKANMLSGMAPTGDTAPKTKKENNPNFDFFNYCGINRPVQIYTTPQDYIEDVTLVPEVCGKDAKIAYESRPSAPATARFPSMTARANSSQRPKARRRAVHPGCKTVVAAQCVSLQCQGAVCL